VVAYFSSFILLETILTANLSGTFTAFIAGAQAFRDSTARVSRRLRAQDQPLADGHILLDIGLPETVAQIK